MTPEDLEAIVAANRDLFDPRWRGIEFCSGWGELFGGMLDHCRSERAPLVTASREKLGSLRLYFADQSDTGGRKIRAETMRRSEHICEICGQSGTTVIISPGFVGTRCAAHLHE